MNRYFGRIVTRSESHSRQANSSTLFAVVSPGGGRSDVFDMEVFLASRRLSARSARHRCWSALERFDLRAFASVPAMPSKKNGISPEIGDEENRATIVAAPPNLSFAAFNDDVDHALCNRHRSELRHDPARMVACCRSGWRISSSVATKLIAVVEPTAAGSGVPRSDVFWIESPLPAHGDLIACSYRAQS